jgi:hypothetical protein
MSRYKVDGEWLYGKKKKVDGEWPSGSGVNGVPLFSCCGPVGMAGERGLLPSNTNRVETEMIRSQHMGEPAKEQRENVWMVGADPCVRSLEARSKLV